VSSSSFSVFRTPADLDAEVEQVNDVPLDADTAVITWALACAKRTTGRAWVVSNDDDTITLDWNSWDGLTFPPQTSDLHVDFTAILTAAKRKKG